MSIHSCASNRPGHEAHVWALQLTIVFLATALKLQCNLEHVFNWPIVSEISMSRASHIVYHHYGLPLVKPTWRGVAVDQAYVYQAWMHIHSELMVIAPHDCRVSPHSDTKGRSPGASGKQSRLNKATWMSVGRWHHCMALWANAKIQIIMIISPSAFFQIFYFCPLIPGPIQSVGTFDRVALTY